MMNCYHYRLLLQIACLAGLASAVDYCNLVSCRGAKHIACGNNNKIAASCAANATFVDLTSLKDAILISFNTKRNTVAGGNVPSHETAVRMATMQWDAELAHMAGLNVKTCQFAHDDCRNTAQYKGSGQNLGMTRWYGTRRQTKELVLGHIDSWFGEYKDCNMTFINKFSNSDKVIGHFTVMVADKNTRVGCAALQSKYDDGKNVWDRFVTACNFATTNWMGQPIYVSGPVASGCTAGRNPKYPNLCSVNEKYAGL